MNNDTTLNLTWQHTSHSGFIKKTHHPLSQWIFFSLSLVNCSIHHACGCILKNEWGKVEFQHVSLCSEGKTDFLDALLSFSVILYTLERCEEVLKVPHLRMVSQLPPKCTLHDLMFYDRKEMSQANISQPLQKLQILPPNKIPNHFPLCYSRP